MKLLPREEHKRLTMLHNEIDYYQQKDKTNLYLGIALGIIFTLCIGVYVVTSMIELVSMPLIK